MKYDVIVSDYPWAYNQRPNGFNDGEQGKKTKFGGGAPGTYDLMSDQDVLDTGPLVNAVAADESIHYMWATWPRLLLALELMHETGFEYKTCAFLWEKINKDGSPAGGPGAYTASNSEPCLLGVKRKRKPGVFSLRPERKMINQIVRMEELIAEEDVWTHDSVIDHMNGQVILTPRSKHSQKPETVQDRIEIMHPGKSKLEMFARRSRQGWTTTGNQCDTNQMDIRDFLRLEALK